MIIEYFFLLILGLGLLLYGGNALVDNSSRLARRLGLSELIIGLTIVAFGTSAPELVVTLLGISTGTTGLAIGNIIGSNIVNILLIFGLGALIAPITISQFSARRELPINIFIGILLVLFTTQDFIFQHSGMDLNRIEGLLFLILFGIIVFLSFRSKPSQNEDIATRKEQVQQKLYETVGLIILGLILLIVGGEFVVQSASHLAREYGINDTAIGLSIVAIGTSLPEIITILVASLKRKGDLALGGIIGSCIFNTLFILGVGAVISPLSFTPGNIVDKLVYLGATVLLFVFTRTGRKNVIERWEGAVMIGLYVVYLGWIFTRI